MQFKQKHAEEFELDTRNIHICSQLTLQPSIHGNYFISSIHYFIQTVSHDGRQRSARRFSNLPWVDVHEFYFNALLLMFSFYSAYFNGLGISSFS